MRRLRFVAVALVLTVVAAMAFATGSGEQSGTASAGSSSAAWTPTKDFTIRVPFAAGGAFDTAARIVAQGLQKAYDRTVIVKNVTGANGSVAALDLASVPPAATEMMGGAIGMFTLTPLFNASFSMKLDDYEIVSGMISEDVILVVDTANSGIKSWQDLVD